MTKKVNSSHYRTETVFDYSWKHVVQAYWNRYPNPSSKHVLTEDTVLRDVRNGKLFSRRLLSKTNPVPKWGERFYKNAPVRIIEDSVLDPNTKTLTTFTRNIGFKKIMCVDEIVEYTEQPDGRTLVVRKAYISSQVFGFSRAIRAFAVERFKSNCVKTANGFNYVLTKMFPNQKIFPIPTQHTSIDASSNNQTTKSLEHHQTAPSKTETLKKNYKNSYEYIKHQASKLAQLFSVKN